MAVIEGDAVNPSTNTTVQLKPPIRQQFYDVYGDLVPSTVVLQDTYVVSWENFYSAQNCSIVTQVFNKRTNEVLKKIEIPPSDGASFSRYSSVGFDNDKFVIVYDGGDINTRTGFYNLSAQIFNARGSRLGSVFQINDNDNRIKANVGGGFASLSSLGFKRFMVIWKHLRLIGGPNPPPNNENIYNIYGQIVDTYQNKIYKSFLITSFSNKKMFGLPCSAVHMASGDTFIVWGAKYMGSGNTVLPIYGRILATAFDMNNVDMHYYIEG